MSKGRDRMVYRNISGQWVNKRNDTERASSVHDTQEEALKAARIQLRNSGGGELTIKGRDGEIRDKDTIAHGNDPRSTKG